MSRATRDKWRTAEFSYNDYSLENRFQPYFWVVYYEARDGKKMKSFFDKEETAQKFAFGKDLATVAKAYISDWEVVEVKNISSVKLHQGDIFS